MKRLLFWVGWEVKNFFKAGVDGLKSYYRSAKNIFYVTSFFFVFALVTEGRNSPYTRAFFILMIISFVLKRYTNPDWRGDYNKRHPS